MSAAGPSQSYPAPKARDRTNHEEDHMRMITELELEHSDIGGLWQVSLAQETRIQRGHTLSDQEIAFGLLVQNARELASIEADRAAAQRLALEEDGEPNPAPRVQPSNVPQKATKKAKSMPVLNDRAASSSEKGKAPARPTGHDCVICQDPIFEAEVQAPCGHFYDISCITDLFKSATRDESLYPPRCCRQAILLPQVRQHFTQALLADFELKAQEFGTLKRVYCAAPACSRFLGPLYEGLCFKIYECTSSTCTTATCGRCCTKHEEFNHCCAPDGETERVLTLGQTSGWQRCPGCAQMIELNMGCNHMTCRCKTQFCYICCARWKTCTCPQWDENRLFTAAERRADAQLQHANRWQPILNNRFRPLDPPVPTTGAAQNQPVNPPQQEPAAELPRPAAIVQRLIVPPVPTAQRTVFQVAPSAYHQPSTSQFASAYYQPAASQVAPSTYYQFYAFQVAQSTYYQPSTFQVAPSTYYQPSTFQVAPSAYYQPAPFTPFTPFAYYRPATLHAEVPVTAPPPSRTAANTVATVPAPHAPIHSWAEVSTQEAGNWNQLWTEGSRNGVTDKVASRSSSNLTVDWDEEANGRESFNEVNISRDRLVRDIMERLRVNHDCLHTSWKYRSGGGICDSCFEYLPNYLFQCEECETLGCNRCRLNRL